ncbi:hypothetical protein ACFTWS_40490 [Streptomyces sp. NPDC057027]|uniref:hypothetical protein n=1 Tax=Streptomyces sp. NPDC057027 TaxID=3346004 RepID=UPI003628C442
MVLDKRRVQTTVIGDAVSESPVVLPLEAVELNAFRRLHAGDGLTVEVEAAREAASTSW